MSKFDPNTATLQDHINQGIADGVFDCLSRSDSIHELADQFGVSPVMVAALVESAEQSA